MQRFSQVGAATVVVGLSLAAQSAGTVISGRVVAAGTDRPIAGARLLLNESDAVRSATTDADGGFEFRGPCARDRFRVPVQGSAFRVHRVLFRVLDRFGLSAEPEP